MVALFRPLMPAISVQVSAVALSLGTMRVPTSSGRLVLRMATGMDASRTGRMASSWNTLAPM